MTPKARKVELPGTEVLQRLVETAVAYGGQGKRQREFALAAANEYAALRAYAELASEAGKEAGEDSDLYLLALFRGALLQQINRLIASLETEEEKEAVRRVKDLLKGED